MTRDLLVGLVIGSGFGVLWVFLGSDGLAGSIALIVRIVAVGAFAVILVRVVMLLRTAAPRGGGSAPSMFGSRAYLVIVVIEVLALILGARLLDATGLGRYGITWTAIVVGLHFVGFGWFFQPLFYRLAAAQLTIGVAGVVVGLAGGSATAIAAVTGLTSGTLYLVGMLSAVFRQQARASGSLT